MVSAMKDGLNLSIPSPEALSLDSADLTTSSLNFESLGSLQPKRKKPREKDCELVEARYPAQTNAESLVAPFGEGTRLY